MIFKTCPACGCNLDPCERCDCQDNAKEAAPAATGTTSNEKSRIQFINRTAKSQGRQEVAVCQARTS